MAEKEILGVALGKGRWYNANEQKMIKLPIGEDGRIVRDENRTGQEIRKGDTLEIPECYIKLAEKMAKHGYSGRGKEMAKMILSIIKE